MQTDQLTCFIEHIFHKQKRRSLSKFKPFSTLMITLASVAFASFQALAQPQDYFSNTPCISPFGEDRYPEMNFGFDYVALPPVVAPGQPVSAAVQWSFFNPSDSGAVYYISAFGDWQAGNALTNWVGVISGTQTISNSFTFQPPTKPGCYRIRFPIVLAYAPVTNFFGGPAGGQYSPGTGPCYTEVRFTVKAPSVQDYFSNTLCISPYGEDRYKEMNFGFDYVALPPVVAPGQPVPAAVQWSFVNPSDSGAVYYISAFGDWQAGNALTNWVSIISGTQTISNSFTFQAPTTPGCYRIRFPIVLAYAPVTNFYGGPADGQYSPGTGPCYTEVGFTVKAPRCRIISAITSAFRLLGRIGFHQP